MSPSPFIVKLVTGIDKSKPIIGFDGVVGQKTVVNKLTFFLSAHCPETPFPTLLFDGSHGLGKTFVAKKVAQNLGRRFVEVNAATVVTAKDFIDRVLIDSVLGKDTVTILIDEAHSLTSEITTILLTLLAPNSENRNFLSYKNWNIEYDMTKINLILATTDVYKIFNALSNRAERIYFDPYDNKDMLDMLALYLPDIKIDCDKEDLANACRGRGRDAYQLAQNIYRHCKMGKVKVLTQESWERFKNVFGINPLGLNKQEVNLLRVIKQYAPISCSNISMKLMLNEDNAEIELEGRLQELSLISNTTKGRILTDRGESYFKLLEGKR